FHNRCPLVEKVGTYVTNTGLMATYGGQFTLTCIIVQWDANSNGIWDREPVKESDQIGFRLKEHVLETLRGATSCEGKGWDKVTNPDAIIIDTFQVVRQDVSGFSPVLTVNMRAASKSEPQTVVNASYSVTGFNL
ncbi:TPA: prepilin peptidase-dependent protein, partial [Shigella flexneri]